MLNSIKKRIFPFIIAISALSVSASAAFYSISGLSKLFVGASTEVIIMASSLEVAKLVIASLLYQYWSNLNMWLRTYLTLSTLILILITSMGIYGFLSAAYQEVYQDLTINQNKIEFLKQKEEFYNKDIIKYDDEINKINTNISILSQAKSSIIQIKDTSSNTGFRNTISTTEIKLAQNRINIEEENKVKIQEKRNILNDSLQKYRIKILEAKNEIGTIGELGPLTYISGLTNIPMDKVINILILIIIFVFDPLAISLVIAANFAFKQINNKEENMDLRKIFKKNPPLNDIETISEEIIKEPPTPPNSNLIEAVKKYNEKLENKEIQPNNEVEIIKKRLEKGNISSWKKRKLTNKLNNLEK